MFDKLKLLLLKVAFDTVVKERDELRQGLRKVSEENERLRRELKREQMAYQGLSTECERLRSVAETERKRANITISKFSRGPADPQESEIHSDKLVCGYAIVREHIDGTRFRIDPRNVIIRRLTEHKQD